MPVLILKHPLTFGKLTVNKLTFRDYTTAGDYLAFDRRGGVAQRIALIASMSGTDEALVQQLRGADYQAAAKIVDDMIANDEESLVTDSAAPKTEGDGEKK